MWIGALVLIAVMVYLLRYVWRVLLFGPRRWWRGRSDPRCDGANRTPDAGGSAAGKSLPADVDRVVFAAGEGVLTLVDSLVMGCAVLIVMSTQMLRLEKAAWATRKRS
jgi:ATP-binding cassette subfamily B multidrug efflux pump